MSETNNQTQAEQVTVSKEQLDVLDQLLKPEVQESLTTLVEQLPKLTEMMTLLTKSYEFAQAVATDEVLKNDTVGAVTEIAGPVVGSAKNLAATAIEAKDRAAESHEVIGLFGLVKMLKDPQVQNVFRFVNAFLQVNAERKAK
ncbi:DUF1641 domain-containing protein [Lysinibacillus irui]|uniref:DUF1641 domain-containing protein n=1 Tax=Lysinibacillus irui TaxID=2998077 RepID=A0AAJ5RK64_9BACI|nr:MULTISPECIES: DUF1641 domain-containing protein [Lysinibacillus]MEA0556341.1 DUF1641 domain-containing protein [Lysinibacillus irui]MEA0563782.1 DUF1641 domain-containing protein [Lysinibacillus irui]MEA0979075.1 DUF1641 domain-containing protein [Lysinibacillus irui]MEA1045229.1 DUF1641 domain-containing protein [Lysinibacillus irui]WDV07171.1 DUF1641 domain-containing protein [Lysinibacillus irui]